ncbi:MAG TPA: hypothetical protein VJK52_06175, partial [Candidatus Nanoarchaeia archaeon]|nr:hypothetical protein [Candidatus Nanoarchaeia archaeon]
PDSFAVTRQYATKLDHADTVTIELPRVVTKPIHVVKKNLIKNEEWVLDPQARALEENEKAIITVERIRTSPYEEEFVETTMLTGEETADLRLVPGTYRVNVELIASDTFITIPRKEVGNLLGSETIPAVQVAEGTFHAGTMRLEDWVVTPMQLAQDNQLRFSALNFALAEVPEARRSHKDLEVMGRFGQYVQEQRAEFIPRFEAR